MALEASADLTVRVKAALLVFAACGRDLLTDERGDDYAKFRLLKSDYQRAYALYVELFGEPPYPGDVHAALPSLIGAK